MPFSFSATSLIVPMSCLVLLYTCRPINCELRPSFGGTEVKAPPGRSEVALALLPDEFVFEDDVCALAPTVFTSANVFGPTNIVTGFPDRSLASTRNDCGRTLTSVK